MGGAWLPEGEIGQLLVNCSCLPQAHVVLIG